jgi:Ca-activated chloride channel family protein
MGKSKRSGRAWWLLVWMLTGAACAHDGPAVPASQPRHETASVTEQTPQATPPRDGPSAPALEEPLAQAGTAQDEAAPATSTTERRLRSEPKAALRGDKDDLDARAPAAPPPAPVEAEAAGKPSAKRKAESIVGVSGMAQGGRGMAIGAGYGHGVVAKQLAAPSAELQAPEMNREAYAHVAEQSFSPARAEPLSTFSIDVDTASYSNVRRFLRDGSLPPADAVRIEELVNYFDYDYPQPSANEPFSIYTEVGDCPWNSEHRLVHVGIQGREISQENVPARNLVFLVDVSGSMQDPNKLPLLKQGLTMLARDLRPQDHVAIAVYAGSSGLALPATSGRDAGKIIDALGRLEAGGSTNGAEGIELAYREAQKNFVKGGINRVILATDGDFNVGASSEGELVRLIEEKKKSGVFLTVLGFGSGNLQDSRMEQLADKGNGNYAYIDTLAEAHKVLVREAGSTLVTIAKDVKLQVEWNPAAVASYRLIGYENRALAARDFNDDKKDAGEIGAGHNVTALYEIVPVGQEDASLPSVDPLRYQASPSESAQARSGELLTVKVRYKSPDAETSQLMTRSLPDQHRALSSASDSFRFSAAVAGFGMLLRDSKHRGALNLRVIDDLARGASQRDAHGDRGEFLDMVRAAQRLGLGS